MSQKELYFFYITSTQSEQKPATVDSTEDDWMIFLLGNFRNKNRTLVLEEAEKRINKLCISNFGLVAKELKGLDSYQYTRAVSAGVQEFVEVMSEAKEKKL